MRNFNIFNRKSFAEDQIIGQAEKGLKKDDDSQNNRRPNFQSPPIDDSFLPEDEYVIKQRREMAKIDAKEDIFTDANGRQTPINNLYPADPFDTKSEDQTKELWERDRDAYLKQKSLDEQLKKKEENSKEDFESNRRIKHTNMGSRYNFRTGYGLYKDYNSKLNAGAPGNREERYRQARQLAEKEKFAHFDRPDQPTKAE